MTDSESNWGAEPWRQPTELEGETVYFSECGRVMNRTDYRSHWFKLVRGKFGFVFLLVKHGGGEERFKLTYNTKAAEALATLDSDARYLLLHMFFSVWRNTRSDARKETASKYSMAFVEGRLKKRKKQGRYIVSIEDAETP